MSRFWTHIKEEEMRQWTYKNKSCTYIRYISGRYIQNSWIKGKLENSGGIKDFWGAYKETPKHTWKWPKNSMVVNYREFSVYKPAVVNYHRVFFWFHVFLRNNGCQNNNSLYHSLIPKLDYLGPILSTTHVSKKQDGCSISPSKLLTFLEKKPTGSYIPIGSEIERPIEQP